MPNLKKLTAVEPDTDQMAGLKTRVAQLLPDVRTEFHQETAESWQGGDERFDAVLLFHCLYYVPLSQRPVLYKKLFDKIVADGGLVFILTTPCDIRNPTMLTQVSDLLGVPKYNLTENTDGVQISDMMAAAGFHECYQLPLGVQLNVQEPNDDLMSVFVYWSRGTLSLDQARDAAKQVFGNLKYIPNETWFGAFQKP